MRATGSAQTPGTESRFTESIRRRRSYAIPWPPTIWLIAVDSEPDICRPASALPSLRRPLVVAAIVDALFPATNH